MRQAASGQPKLHSSWRKECSVRLIALQLAQKECSVRINSADISRQKLIQAVLTVAKRICFPLDNSTARVRFLLVSIFSVKKWLSVAFTSCFLIECIKNPSQNICIYVSRAFSCVTLITLQTFESEFHLRSLPCAFSRQLTFVLVCSTLFAAADHVQEIAVLWERLSELRSHFRSVFGFSYPKISHWVQSLFSSLVFLDLPIFSV